MSGHCPSVPVSLTLYVDG